jgi:hypothetical protein
MTHPPEHPRRPDAAPAQAPPAQALDYAGSGLARPGQRPVARQMLEAFGLLVLAAVFCLAVVIALEAARGGFEEAGGTLACVAAATAVLVITHRRRAWRGLLFVMILLIALVLLLIGLCFAVFAFA